MKKLWILLLSIIFLTMGCELEKGEAGQSAYDLWVSQEGNEGKSEQDFLDSLKGEKGEDGVGIASIELLGSEGLEDLYLITYTDQSTYTFIITNGADGQNGLNGSQGDSAYDLWLTYPENDGKTLDDFFESLKGEKGDNGLSAYEAWKQLPGNEYRSFYEFLYHILWGEGCY